ncbi:hypothetical protein POM88_021700 [Heracleum sosnowskyi]|uniref:Uncharacterized protein n=1 Tax=Heracleum sosnowskyi TaxID=360622 RepID=A0AAD8IHE0_9APIA|nr:hypothetical protein POM88_021700 [Heracleum sosnowskyi]
MVQENRIIIPTNQERIRVDEGEISSKITGNQQNMLVEAGKATLIQNEDLIFMDPKRRRTGKPNNYGADVKLNQEDEEFMDYNENEILGQKNGQLAGDLNNLVSQDDKKGGAPYPGWLIEGLNRTVVDTGLRDMELVGHQFTWERG